MRMWRNLVPLVMATLVVACGSDGRSGEPGSGAEVPAGGGTYDPLPAIVRLVEEITSGDVDAVLAAVRYQRIACVVRPRGIGGPPPCPPGVADGTELELLPVGTCEAELWDEETLASSLRRLGALALVGVYRWPGGAYDAGPLALTPEHVALFAYQGPAGDRLAFEVLLEDGMVVGLEFGCGETPEALAERQGLEDSLVDP